MAYTTIDDPTAYFQTVIYTGNATARAITFDGNTDMQPDWVWGKQRSGTDSHQVSDSVRGATKKLNPDTTAAEDTTSTHVTAFNSNGFSVGTGGGYNGNTIAQVAWCWKKTATAGFDIVAYTGTGSSNAVSHSLSATPNMMIIKNRDDTDSWYVWHQGLGAVATNYITLDTTGAASSVDNGIIALSSSNFTVNTRGDVNENNMKYIAYCFAQKQGFSKIGSYIGTGSDVFIHTGFKVGWLLVKNADNTNGWLVIDTKRSPANPQGKYIYANASSAEGTVTYGEFFSNGFGWKGTGSVAVNQSGEKFIYYAIAENPFVTSTGVPATAR